MTAHGYKFDWGTSTVCPSCGSRQLYERSQTADWRCAKCESVHTSPEERPTYVGEEGAVLDAEMRTKAIQRAAEVCGEPLTQQAYEEWRDDDPTVPGTDAIRERWGWSAACVIAGVSITKVELQWHYIDLLEAVIHIAEDLGEWPTIKEYKQERRQHHPPGNWIYKNEKAADSWNDVITDATHFACRL